MSSSGQPQPNPPRCEELASDAEIGSDFEEVGFSDLESFTEQRDEGDNDDDSVVTSGFGGEEEGGSKLADVSTSLPGSGAASASATTTSIFVEIPPRLLLKKNQQELDPTGDISHVTEKGISAEDSVQSCVSSTASSFVPVSRLRNMALQSDDVNFDDRENDDEKSAAPAPSLTSSVTSARDWTSHDSTHNSINKNEDERSLCSWQSLATTTKMQGKSGSDVADDASSVISGFDILSINGSNQRRCQRCTFLNDDHDDARLSLSWCGGCGAVLVASSSSKSSEAGASTTTSTAALLLDMDAQIALNLQRKEEKNALDALRQEERKRKMLVSQPLLVQAQVFSKDITQCASRYHGVAPLPETDSVLQASQFIEAVSHFKNSHSDWSLELGYHFTSKFDDSLKRIRRQGLGPGSCAVSKDADAAMRAASGVMNTIPEEQDITSGSKIVSFRNRNITPSATNCLGWIVAIVRWGVLASPQPLPSGAGDSTAALRVEQYPSSHCLPLVSFDASLLQGQCRPYLEGVLNAFSVTVKDFFLTDWTLTYPSDNDDLEGDDILAAAAASAANTNNNKVPTNSSGIETTSSHETELGRDQQQNQHTSSFGSPVLASRTASSVPCFKKPRYDLGSKDADGKDDEEGEENPTPQYRGPNPDDTKSNGGGTDTKPATATSGSATGPLKKNWQLNQITSILLKNSNDSRSRNIDKGRNEPAGNRNDNDDASFCINHHHAVNKHDEDGDTSSAWGIVDNALDSNDPFDFHFDGEDETRS